MGVAHWDEVEPVRLAKGEMDARWQRLGDAAGTRLVGVSRVRVEPGRLPTPPHSHGASEELYFVLAGSGLARSRAVRIGWPWVEGRDDDPWDVEAAAEPLVAGEPAPRPANIVNVDEVEHERARPAPGSRTRSGPAPRASRC